MSMATMANQVPDPSQSRAARQGLDSIPSKESVQ